MLFYYNYINPFADNSYYSSYLYFGIAIIALVSISLGVPLGYLAIQTLEGSESAVSKKRSLINPFMNKENDTMNGSTQKYGIFTLILVGLLLYILFYLPLDVLFNLIPGILEYQATSLSQSAGGEFYLANFEILSIRSSFIAVSDFGKNYTSDTFWVISIKWKPKKKPLSLAHR